MLGTGLSIPTIATRSKGGITPYRVTTNRLRTPLGVTATGGLSYGLTSIYLGAAPWETRAFRFGFPAHIHNTAGTYPVEAAAPAAFTIVGFSLGFGPTTNQASATWVRGTIAGASSAYIDPAVNSVGVVSDDVLTNSVVPAGYHRWLRVVTYIASGNLPYNAIVTTSANEYAAFLASDPSAKLTDGSVLTTAAAGAAQVGYTAAYAVARGGRGKRAYLVWGDSIGYGANEPTQAYNDGISGFLSRGLDDRATSGNVRFGLNWCVSGSKASDIAAYGSAAYAKKKALLDLLPNVPFDAIIHEHITNGAFSSLSDGVAKMKGAIASLRSSFGALPVYQTTLVPKIASTTDGYGSTSGQTVTPNFQTGGFMRQLSDKFAADLLDNTLTGVIDTGARVADATAVDKIKPSTSPSTTLAADYVSGATTMTVVDASIFNVGDLLFPDPAGWSASGNVNTTRSVKSKSGNVITLSAGLATSGLTAGTVVRTALLSDGIHLTRAGHVMAAPAVTEWRDAQVAAGY